MNSKLIEILTSFSDGEWKKFENFINFHENESSRNYTLLLKEIKSIKDNGHDLYKLNVMQLFKSAYGTENFKYQTLKNRQSELLRLCKTYLVESSIKKNDLLNEVVYSSELLSRNLVKNYKSFLIKKNKLTESNIFNEESYKHLKDLTLDEAGFYQIIKEENTKVNKTYKIYSDYLLADVLNNLIETAIELQMIKRIYNQQFEFDYFPEVLNSINSSGIFKKLEQSKNNIFLFSLIRFHIFASEFLTQKSDQIRRAERLYFENEEIFPVKFKMEIYKKFMSYYTNKINNGEKKFQIKVYRLIRRKLNQNIIEDIKRPAGYNVFREYIINGIQLKKYNWVENLITEYSHLLPEDIREMEISTSLMRLAFARRDFNKALKITESIKETDFIHYVDTCIHKLAIFYELKRYDEAYNEIIKIRRHLGKDIFGRLDKTILFLKAYKKLLNYTVNSDKDRNYFLYIMQKEKVTYMMKDWLIEKAKELIKIK